MLHIIILRAGRAERAGIRSRHCRDSALRRRCRARGRARAQRKGKRSAVRSPPFTDALRACLSALRDACTSPSRRFVRTVAVLFCSRYTSAIRVEIFVVFFFAFFFTFPPNPFLPLVLSACSAIAVYPIARRPKITRP